MLPTGIKMEAFFFAPKTAHMTKAQSSSLASAELLFALFSLLQVRSEN